MQKKITQTGIGFDGKRFQRLRGPRPASPLRLARAFDAFRRRHPFKLGLVNVLFTLLLLSGLPMLAGCAHREDEDASENHSHHHGRGHNGGASAGGQNTRDSLGLSPSATPVPGM